MKPGAFNATIFIRTLAQATGEVDGEESWRGFTPKRASSRGTAAGAVFWWLREQQTPPHPSGDVAKQLGSQECGPRSAVPGVRSQECGPRSAVPGVRPQDCGPRTAVLKLQSPTLQLRTIV
ncbi:hypothetical protein NQZ68_000112 [Dissostichus eleginoides]|nr:hypothetical protein NQZ68_000112 [Dissostichus eleginoides]